MLIDHLIRFFLEKAQNLVRKQLEIKATHDILDGKF
jgi:hypothetical protein